MSNKTIRERKQKKLGSKVCFECCVKKEMHGLKRFYSRFKKISLIVYILIIVHCKVLFQNPQCFNVDLFALMTLQSLYGFQPCERKWYRLCNKFPAKHNNKHKNRVEQKQTQ